MITKDSRNFLTFLCFVVMVFLLGFFAKQQAHRITEKRRLPCYWCENRLSSDTITPLTDNLTFIISPYYDRRDKPIVRTLSIVHHKDVKELYCWFCCGDSMSSESMQVSKVEMDKHSDRFGFPFVTTDLLCTEPPNCNAKYLSIQPSDSVDLSAPFFQISNRDTEDFTAKFTVCISTMFGKFSNVLQFIQTMEMYRILGAQRVMIYLNSCSPLMEKVMQYYIRQGMLEVIPWPLERYLRPAKAWHFSIDPKDIGYYGQLPTLNDCIYRNMYRSHFVLLNDIDEIILPFEHQTWDSMMEDLEHQYPNAGIFLFENHVFPQTVATDGNFTGTSLWKDVPGFNILQYIYREPDRSNLFNARKMIIDPRKVIQTSVHSVLKSYGRQVKVPLKTALVHHCRGPLQQNLNRTLLIKDTTIWKYNVPLITSVNKVLSEISLLEATRSAVSI
ncbi:uncharacterized protein PAF06_000240 [Gastrophryne carolinensis]